MESHSRSIAKAISYRALGSIGTAIVVIILSKGDWKLSLSAGLIDSVLKVGLYFLHERIWTHINYGKQPPAPEYEI